MGMYFFTVSIDSSFGMGALEAAAPAAAALRAVIHANPGMTAARKRLRVSFVMAATFNTSSSPKTSL